MPQELAGSQPVRVAGSRPQGPVGQVSRQLGARAPGLARPAGITQITIFRKPSGGSLAKAWVSAETAASEVGPGGKRSRDTPPRFGAVREKRVSTLRLRQPSNTPPKVGGL